MWETIDDASELDFTDRPSARELVERLSSAEIGAIAARTPPGPFTPDAAGGSASSWTRRRWSRATRCSTYDRFDTAFND